MGNVFAQWELDELLPDRLTKLNQTIIFGLKHLAPSYDDHLVRIKAVGHLCDGSGSYSTTSADIVVAPMEVANA